MRAPDPNAAGDDNYTPPPALAHINLGAYLFDPPGANDGDVYYNTNANSLRVYDRSLASWIQVSGAITGTTAPTTIPTYLGQTYLDSTNKINYIATGTTATTDWNGIPFLSTANTFTAAQTLSPSSGTAATINAASSAVGLQIKVNAANALTVRNNADTSTVASIDQYGGASFTYATLISDAASTRPLAVRGASGQTANLQEWQATGGTVLSSVSSAGALTVSPTTGASAASAATITAASSASLANIGLSVYANSGGGFGDVARFYNTNAALFSGYNSSAQLFVRSNGSIYNAAANISTGSDSLIGAVIRGNSSSQTADLQQWQATGGTVLASVSSSGALTLSPSTGTAATFNAASSGVGQIIKVNGADALRVRNNADTGTIANIDSSGNIWGNIVRGGSSATDIGGIISGLGYSTGAVKVAVFRGGSLSGAATQIGDLIQFQTGATGNAVLGGINAVGQFYNGSTLPTSFATGGTIQSIATGANPLITTGSAHTLSVGDLVTLAGTTGGTYNGTFIVLSTPLTTTFTIATSLTTGQAGTGGTITAPAQASITARSTGTVGLTVSPISSSSAEVARFYHGNGSTYSGFDAAARFFVRTSGITHGTPSFAVNTASDTAIGAVIRGNSATQSADLQQWQTSAAAVGTRVVAGGGIIAVEPIVTSTAGAGTTTTLDCSTGTTFTVTFGAGNVTGFLFTNLPAAGSTTITLILKQDGTGSRTVTWSGTQVNGSATNATPKWAGGTAPTLTTTANAVDIVTLVINRTGGSTDNVYGFLAGKAFA